jgi:chemotaxis protein methyltransferase CheR
MISRHTDSRFSEREYELFRTLVRERSGLELADARRPELDRAVLEALESSGTDSPEELCAHMSQAEGRSALEGFLAALTVHESHFFRSSAQFDALRSEVLPDLIAARSASRRLRVWSAGCAGGEEPYSVAILLEQLLPKIADWDVLVLATDLSAAALETAKRGLYRRWSFREVPPEIERRYFEDREGGLEVVSRIRDRVRFARLNLAADRYPSLLSNTVDMDLVLCRNVLIYFGAAQARRVLGRLGAALAVGGWLVLGQAEAGMASDAGLVPRRIGGTVMYQKTIGGWNLER